MASKSLEIVNEHIEFFKKYREAYAHASDIESAKDYDDDIKVFETIKKDLEAYEQLKRDHDKTLINNGELCVKVCELEKENQEFKKIIKENFFYHEYSEEIGYRKPMPKYQDKIKEVLNDDK